MVDASAFQQALKIGRREESTRMEGRRWVEKRTRYTSLTKSVLFLLGAYQFIGRVQIFHHSYDLLSLLLLLLA